MGEGTDDRIKKQMDVKTQRFYTGSKIKVLLSVSLDPPLDIFGCLCLINYKFVLLSDSGVLHLLPNVVN